MTTIRSSHNDPKGRLRYSVWVFFLNLGFVVFVTLFFWWLLVLVWIAIKLDSKGPGLFIQERVGRNGSVFKCYKFRTMLVDTKQAATHEVSQSAVTNVGQFLRKTKIDELPQVINLLKNEMSLIGPRPCLPTQSELIAARNTLGVLEINPGISGWAQVQGVDMSNPNFLAKIDAEYIAVRSIGVDTKIIIMTLKNILFKIVH